MRTVLLVPRRNDNGHRDRLWAWARARWDSILPDVPIYEGHHDDGPFQRSAAINRASANADRDGRWDIGIVIDSDIFIRESQVRRAIETARKTKRVTWAHRRWRGLSEEWTGRVINPKAPREFGPEIDREDMDVLVERTNPLSWSCCIAIPRRVWDDIGGFDERFVGWGFEDMAFMSLVCGLHGWERIDGDVYHLWHDRTTDGAGRAAKDHRGYTRDAVTNARLGRRYMVALRRDHGITDRPQKASREELERDIANLKRDDAQLVAQSRRLQLPDWDDWWPSLEELRDGWKALRSTPRITGDGTVTIAVHTDGRREYIARAIPSLLEKVKGPVSKRVIFDDSGDPEYKDWLRAEFPDFYVVGPHERLGYTKSMQALWKYLDRRCVSEFVFLAEDDFTYDRDVELGPMIETLRENDHLRQVALLRHPYYPRELEAGGIVQEHPEAYELQNSRPYPFLEHRLYFTANPSLFRRSLTATPWPNGTSSEKLYTDLLNRNPSSRFAYWGTGDPWITHIGAVRAGTGY